MSTKCSIAYDQGKYHMYVECFDDGLVYIEQPIKGVEFKIDSTDIMVSVPAEVMDILQRGGYVNTWIG